MLFSQLMLRLLQREPVDIGHNDGFSMVGIDVQPMKYTEYYGDDNNGHRNEIEPEGTVILE
jgi:hypothetical protein